MSDVKITNAKLLQSSSLFFVLCHLQVTCVNCDNEMLAEFLVFMLHLPVEI